jgi:hypothetical protein
MRAFQATSILPVRPVQYIKDIPSSNYPSNVNSLTHTSDPEELYVQLHVPSLGFIVIPITPTPVSNDPRSLRIPPPQILNGEVEIRVPVGYRSRRCLGVRLVFVCWCRLNHGGRDGREQEGDVLSREEIRLKDEFILEEGTQR